MPNNTKHATLEAYIVYYLPSVADLVRYFNATTGFPDCYTWLKAIGAGNYSLWAGLTLTNETKYCPSTEATIIRHLVQKR